MCIRDRAETALKEFGHVDIWVNNAGVEASFPTIDMPLKEWQRVIDVNLNGVFLGSREAVSYTHLDVYKRQDCMCGGLFDGCDSGLFCCNHSLNGLAFL